MASVEQTQMLLQQNAEFMVRLQQDQTTAMQTLVQTLVAQVHGAVHAPGGGIRGLDTRKFRDIDIFDGSEAGWREWSQVWCRRQGGRH